MNENTVLAAALDYAAKGWPVFPCARSNKKPLSKHGFKDATTDAGIIRAWWDRWPSANVGVPTGARIGGLAVIDVDPRHGGNESLQALEGEYGPLPKTLESRTGGGGRHIFFAVNGTLVRNDAGNKLGEGLDVRGEGGYVVVAPSIHMTGKPYEWTCESAPALLPPWLAQKVAAPLPPEEAQAAESISKGKRNDTLTRDAGAMQRRGMSPEALVAALLAENSARCQPPLPEQEVRGIAASVGRYEPAAANNGTQPLETVLVRECFADIVAKPIEWDWPERIPRAKLTIFSGDPDLGKSTVACDVVARYTQKLPWPDGAANEAEPGDVLMMVAEDDPEDTTKPRLMAAEADMNRVHLLRCIRITQGAKKSERMLALDTDLALLEAELKVSPEIKLVVIDPITNYFGRANVNRDQELRAVLVPIKELADRKNVTFIGVGHFNKRSDVTALHRIGGAVAMSGVARAVWMFMKNPEVEGEYLMLLGKGNLTKKRTGMRYRIVEKIVDLPNNAKTGVPTIDWQRGESQANVDDTLATVNDPAGRKSAKAKRFLIDFLADGDKPSEEIFAKGAEKGLKRNALFDAKKVLDISAYKQGVWWWKLPQAEPPKQREPGEEESTV